MKKVKYLTMYQDFDVPEGNFEKFLKNQEEREKEVAKGKIYHCSFCGNDAPDYADCPTFNYWGTMLFFLEIYELLNLEIPKNLIEKPFICEKCYKNSNDIKAKKHAEEVSKSLKKFGLKIKRAENIKRIREEREQQLRN